MPPTNDPPSPGAAPIARAVEICRRDPRFAAELTDLLSRAEAAVSAGACRACGECCRFVAFGHRLYVSAGELAVLTGTPPSARCEAGRCGYQVGPHCTARGRRPLVFRQHRTFGFTFLLLVAQLSELWQLASRRTQLGELCHPKNHP